MSKKNILWLYGELPKLVSKGVITADVSNKIHDYYGKIEKKDFGNMLLMIFAIMGGVLIGLGIILLFAFNWNDLGRPLRTILSFLPLLISQGLVIFTLLKKRESPAWREGTATFLMLAIAAAIALIGQTYNIPGDLESFLLTWMLLSIPLVYICDVNIVSLLYLIGITCWAGYAQAEGRQAALFWPLLLLLFPRALLKFKENRYSNTSIYLGWTIVLCLTVATGITLEKVLPGLWMIVYSSFFALLYLAGSLWFREAPAIIQRPFHSTGTVGTIVMAYLLTYNWPWEEIGWYNIRYEDRFHHTAAYLDYGITLVLILLTVILLIYSVLKNKKINLFLGLFPALTIGGYLLISTFLDDNWEISGSEGPVLLTIHLVMNFYILAVGVISILWGVKTRKIALLNGGSLIIALLIALRFVFVESFFENLIVRGLIFILIGAGFLIANLIFSSILKKGESHE